MKKYLKLCLIIVIAFMFVNVNAAEHKIVEIFPASESATVKTNTFVYTDFAFVPAPEGRRYGTIEFKSITNNTERTIPVSINILMFDKKKKNIGFLTYCSERDISGDYAQVKIKPNATSEFSINVSDTYFADGKTSKDIAYLAVLDDNEYCHIGGYTKYAGMTIDEIANQNSNSQEGAKSDAPKMDTKKVLYTALVITVLLIVGKICIKLVLKQNDKKSDEPILKNDNNIIQNNNSNNSSGNSSNNKFISDDRNTFIKEEIAENMADVNLYNSSLDSGQYNENAVINTSMNMDTNMNFNMDNNMNSNFNSNINNSNNINNNNNSNNNSNKEGESDLAKFFR